jgi:ABC transporter, phosphonate, periplasmic substrate-binding protein/LrgB-like family
MTIGITAVAAAAVAVGIVTGSLVSLVSGIAVARLARLDPVITMSLAPKSVAAAIAVEIAPAVDANFFFYGKPIYHAIVVCKPGHGIKTWPQDGKGKRVSFADVGATSGWLIPTAWFRTRNIDLKTFFAYSDGATHAANEMSVASGRSIAPYDRISRESNGIHSREGVDAGKPLH